jgi:hypothetical protein
MKNKIKVRFILSGRKVKREMSDLKRPIGTEQLIGYITWKNKIDVKEVDGKEWRPLRGESYEEDDNGELYLKRNKYQGALFDEEKGFPDEEDWRIHNRFRSYKIDVKGNLIKYPPVKLYTGIYLLRDSWKLKIQMAEHPYEFVNSELNKLRHIIDVTHAELIQRADFSPSLFLKTIQDRMNHGMPRQIIIPAEHSDNTINTIRLISNELAKADGVSLDKIRNPKGVPDDLREFIPWYHKNRISTDKLEEGTEEVHNQLLRKLNRWYHQTKRILSITESELTDIASFLNWRMFDNEESFKRRKTDEESTEMDRPVRGFAIGMGTMNKTKKGLKYMYNMATDMYGCTIRFTTSHTLLKETNYDREAADVYLTMDQIQNIANLPLTLGSGIDTHRNLFILGCLGGGYRIGDLIKLPEPIKEKFEVDKGEMVELYTFNVRSTKTKIRTMAPIPMEINPIVERFPYGIEIKKHAFRNDIKEIGRLLNWTQPYSFEHPLADGKFRPETKPYNEMLQARTCRKTYCSLLYNYWKLSIQECMAFSGHESEKEFLKYLKEDKKVKAQKLAKSFSTAKPIVINLLEG